MITKGLDKAVRHTLDEVYQAGASGEPEEDVVLAKHRELMALIRAEAVNLSDKIIGKDQIISSSVSTADQEYLNPTEKAVFDFQVKQRIELAKYQKPLQSGVPTGPEVIVDGDLSPNEA